MGVVRFSVSLEGDLLDQFNRYCSEQRFATRSEAVRQLLRERLTTHAWHNDCRDAAGTLTLVYDHHRPMLRDQLMELQHQHNELVVSTLHAHLTHDVCLEVILLRGPAGRLQQLAAQLRGLKGIFKGELVMAAAEEASAPPTHSHPHEPEGGSHATAPRQREHAHGHSRVRGAGHVHPHD